MCLFYKLFAGVSVKNAHSGGEAGKNMRTGEDQNCDLCLPGDSTDMATEFSQNALILSAPWQLTSLLGFKFQLCS